jgi:hypothetical protein
MFRSCKYLSTSVAVAFTAITFTVLPIAISFKGTPFKGVNIPCSSGIGLPRGQVFGFPRKPASASVTSGAVACSRAQASSYTFAHSIFKWSYKKHSQSLCRRITFDATSRPFFVSATPLYGVCVTSPCSPSRRIISLVETVVTFNRSASRAIATSRFPNSDIAFRYISVLSLNCGTVIRQPFIKCYGRPYYFTCRCFSTWKDVILFREGSTPLLSTPFGLRITNLRMNLISLKSIEYLIRNIEILYKSTLTISLLKVE